jgi:hypothetical protein
MLAFAECWRLGIHGPHFAWRGMPNLDTSRNRIKTDANNSLITRNTIASN